MIPAEKPCSRCKVVKPADAFYVRPKAKVGLSSWCRACTAQKTREWQAANPERVKKRQRDWYDRNREAALRKSNEWAAQNRERSRQIKTAWRLANPQAVKQINQAYYQNNADRVKAYNREWRARNPERWATILRLNQRKREARRKNLPAYTITAKDARRILSSPCAVTGCTATDIQFDHVIPIARGGGHGIGNLQPLCGSHNASKHDKTWMEFRLYLRRTCEVRSA